MSDPRIHIFMFNVAKHFTGRAFAKNFAGMCADINYSVLPIAKSTFDDSITLATGWVKIGEQELFKASQNSVVKYHEDDSTPRMEFHVWLQSADSSIVLDLTLIDTLRDKDNFDASIFPDDLRYLDTETISRFGIEYHPDEIGDDVLDKYRRK